MGTDANSNGEGESIQTDLRLKKLYIFTVAFYCLLILLACMLFIIKDHTYFMIVVFFLTIAIGGSLGGFLQAVRTAKSYRLTIPRIVSSLPIMGQHEEVDGIDDFGEVEYIDLGWLGFVYAGLITAFLAVGLLTLSNTVDFSPISVHAFNGSQSNASIPKEILTVATKENADAIFQIIGLVHEHNGQQQGTDLLTAGAAFWALVKLLAISILSGFGGVSLVIGAYNKYNEEFNPKEYEKFKNTVKSDHKMNLSTAFETLLQRARDLVNNRQYNDAIVQCDAILGKFKNNARAYGVKARALAGKEEYAQALKILDKAFALSDLQTDSLEARLHWNYACYLTLDRVPKEINEITSDLKQSLNLIHTRLQKALEKDQYLKSKLLIEKDLNALKQLGSQDITWFDELVNSVKIKQET